MTLRAPLVDKPTVYFPCKTDAPQSGWWQLGRAFLYGAFWAVDFDAKATYLAQAPGPGMGGSVIKAMGRGEESPERTESELEASSAGHWTVLDEEGARSLSAGAISGIVIGSVTLGAVAAAVCFVEEKEEDDSGRRRETPNSEVMGFVVERAGDAGHASVQELEALGVMHDAPAKDMAHELPGKALAAELPASRTE